MQVLTSSLLLMEGSLLVSRAALSVTLIVFLCLTLVHRTIQQQLLGFMRQPLLVGMSVLFLIPFVSGLWSQDLANWMALLRIKLPLLLLPLAFAGCWQLSRKQWLTVAFFFIFITVAGAGWSLIQYMAEPGRMAASYLKAKSLPTPLENDHVRFSWMVSVAVLCCLVVRQQVVARNARLLLLIAACFLAVYLHILAARTGLLCFYFSLFLYALCRLFLHGFSASRLAFIGLFLIFPLVAWWAFPTLRNRAHYMIYDLSFVKSQTYLPGSNDGARSLSIQAGWSILQHHPWGAGAGDISAEEANWYQQHVPGMLKSDQFYPCSEWILYGDMAGWPGLILLTGILGLPFFIRIPHHRFFWVALNGTAALSFLFDMGLEVQYGVFLYAFIILWWYKWFHQAKQ
jgi:O-antigen ligase